MSKLKIPGRVLIRTILYACSRYPFCVFLKEDMHFNFLPFILAATVNTLNVHGTSQTQQGMSVIQRTRSESGLYWAKAGLVAFDTSLYCINIP